MMTNSGSWICYSFFLTFLHYSALCSSYFEGEQMDAVSAFTGEQMDAVSAFTTVNYPHHCLAVCHTFYVGI